MDQIKEILRQAIKYRFWIAVSISAILPVIAYAIGSGPIQKKAAEETEAIKSAKSGVEKYANGVMPNRQYKPIVNEQTAELTKDVNNSWEKLWKRQAPLLTWPDNVEERFRTWGNKWPENVDASTVSIAVIDYAATYPKYVTEVYKSFRPFDPVEGTGVVSAPPEEVLLKPIPFKPEGSSIPELGKVWAAQERLWIQRALLQVVDEVNKNAKDWDSARIKQITLLDVGSPTSQDQVSIAEGVTLEEAPTLNPPGSEGESAEATAAEGMESSAGAEGMMPGMGTGIPGMMGGGAQASLDKVFYVATDPPSEQYKIMPFQIVVLVEQNNIQDVLVSLENSPMAIQVSEFAIAKPAAKVVKPVKGSEMWGGDMMYGGMMPGMMPGMGGMSGFGGAAMMPGMMPGMEGGMMPGMMPGMGGMMPGMGGTAARKGTDARSKDRSKAREEELKKFKEAVGVTIHDPYYSVVELTVYGQARFYNAPPPPPAEEPSVSEDGSEMPAEEGETPKADAAAKPEDAPKADEPAKKDEAAPADPAAEKSEAPKADEPAKKEETAPADPAAEKSEAPKADEPAKKDDAPKAEAAAPENPEPAKADSSAPQPQ